MKRGFPLWKKPLHCAVDGLDQPRKSSGSSSSACSGKPRDEERRIDIGADAGCPKLVEAG